MKLRVIILSMRLPFLILTPVYVFLGASIAVTNQGNISLLLLLLTLFGALLAHISVNTLNEYFDFKSGLDFTTKRTSFSGGSGALPKNPEMVNNIFIVGIASLVATLVIGCFFIWQYGVEIMPIGIVGFVLIITYTKWINRYPLICLIAPGFGFGFLMVVGTQFVLDGEYVTSSFVIAAVPFFLINNLLLLNQYPDIQADAKAGRNHFPIAYGVRSSNIVYGFFTVATISTIVSSISVGNLSALSLIALLPMPLAFFALYGAIKHRETIGDFSKFLGANVAVTVLTPLLLGSSIIIS